MGCRSTIPVLVSTDHRRFNFEGVRRMMERDAENQQKNEPSPANTVPSCAEPSPNIEKSPPVENAERRMPEHDSMVTVRLSEPPSLSVNTDLPPNTLPFRRSIWGHECTPTSATAPVAETIMEEETMSEVEIEIKTPADPPKNMLQESNGITTVDEEEKEKEKEQTDDDDPMDESDTEEVNWDQLQKTEDEQVKDQDDNVCTLPVPSIFIV